MGGSIYNAVISGRAGVAMLVDGPSVYSIDAHSTEPRQRQAEELHLLFGAARDFEFLERARQDEILRRLADAVEREQALDLVLVLLDDDYPADLRAEAAEELEQSLSVDTVADQLDAVLFSTPLPTGSKVDGAMACIPPETTRVRELLACLKKQQPTVRTVQQAWVEAAESTFDSQDKRDEVDAALVRAGAFHKLVKTVDDGSNIDAAIVGLMQNDVLTSRLSRHTLQRSLMAWKASLTAATVQPEPVRNSSVEPEDRYDDSDAEPERIQSYNRPAAAEKARQQVDRIAELVRAGNLVNAKAWVEDLVAFHLRYRDGEEYACKSLCNLAVRLQALGAFALQLELTERATALNRDDVFAWSQLGKARLNVGRYDEALAAYEQASAAHPESVVAKAGRAEVLKALGRYDEALAAYEQASAAHPESVVAKTGRAEVLKAFGRYDEALAAFDQASAAHPEDVVAKAGRAEVLKALGRYDEALAAYDQAAAAHPESVVAKNGRAEVLKALGHYDEALAAYYQATAAHPEDVVAKNGRAEVLKALGRYDEALAAYEQASAAHPEDVVAKAGRAEVLKALGRYDEALAAYEQASAAHPESVVAKTGRAEVLKAFGRYDEALAAFDQASAAHPEDVVAKAGRAEVLKALGRYDEALAAYDQATAAHPESVVAKNGRAEVLKALGRYDKARDAYRAIQQSHPGDQVAVNGLATLLVEMNEFDEAIRLVERETLRTRQEWIGEHIRGMALVAKGKLEQGAEVFERGAKMCTNARQRIYFTTAHASTRIKLRQLDKARQLLEGEEVDAFASDPTYSLRTQLYGLLGDSALAGASYAMLGEPHTPVARDLLGELETRFVKGQPGRHDDDWLLRQQLRFQAECFQALSA